MPRMPSARPASARRDGYSRSASAEKSMVKSTLAPLAIGKSTDEGIFADRYATSRLPRAVTAPTPITQGMVRPAGRSVCFPRRQSRRLTAAETRKAVKK